MFIRIHSKQMLDEVHAKELSEKEKELIKFKRIEKFMPAADRKILWEIFNLKFPEIDREKEDCQIKSRL